MTLTLCTDRTTEIDLDAVSQAVAESDGSYPRLGLLVVAPRVAAKDRLEHALAAGKHPNVRLISLHGLSSLLRVWSSRGSSLTTTCCGAESGGGPGRTP